MRSSARALGPQVVSCPRILLEWKTKRGVRLAAALFQDENGQDLIEYALVAALLGLAAVASMKTLGTKVAGAFSSIATGVTTNV